MNGFYNVADQHLLSSHIHMPHVSCNTSKFVELCLNSNHHLNIIILTKNRLNSDSYYVSGEFIANITERTRVLDMVNIYSLPTQSKQFMQ